MIELYDLGRCTHKPAKGLYEFIVNHSNKFVKDSCLVKELRQHAANREKPGYSIPQEHFSEMCRIWVAAYRSGDFSINVPELIFPDTILRFLKVKDAGRQIGILTSGSREFTEILFDYNWRNPTICRYDDIITPEIKAEFTVNLGNLVDEYLSGEEIGDKDHPETFARLWETRKGDIHSIYDDKLSVCEAAIAGLRQVGGSARLYLVDRKVKYGQGELFDRVKELQAQGVKLIQNFGEVED